MQRGMVAVTVKQYVALWATPRGDAPAGAHGASPAATTAIKLAAQPRDFLIFSSPQSWPPPAQPGSLINCTLDNLRA